MASDARLQITVIFSPLARDVREVVLQLTAGSTVLQALQTSGLLQLFPALDSSALALGVWGHKASLTQVLQDNDRLEIYRPLTVDPKVARRERFARQGARSAGLFVKKRAGAKAGY
jgi:putative ubiquitin-RnfH superfamily antitoxin RatB of RatAB toxin-antitoxin module